MSALSKLTAQRFCELCDDAHSSWRTRRELFEDNPRLPKPLPGVPASYGFVRLGEILQEHAMLQLCKLHDKPVVDGNVTLSIDYVLTYGGWDEPTNKRLERLATKLHSFARRKSLKDARTKTLQHNELAAVLLNAPLGAFAQDQDVAYFENLEEFASIVSEVVLGTPRRFPSAPTVFARALAGRISLDG